MGNEPLIIGVAGGTGSGKTTVVQNIVEHLGPQQVRVILHDFYYRDRSHIPPEERSRVNYDHPDALETELLVQHLRLLRSGSSVEVPQYDFVTHTRLKDEVMVGPADVIIVEGILVLVDQELRKLLDVKVFIETDDDIRFIRRLLRDISERGRSLESVIQQYLETVRPMHSRFVAPSRQHADIVILEGGDNKVAIDLLVTKIRSVVRGRQA